MRTAFGIECLAVSRINSGSTRTSVTSVEMSKPALPRRVGRPHRNHLPFGVWARRDAPPARGSAGFQNEVPDLFLTFRGNSQIHISRRPIHQLKAE